VSQHSIEPPTPGDPRSEGPRPEATWRDAAWAALAAVVVVVTVAQLGRLAYRAATDPDVVLSTGMLVLAFVVTVVWLMTVFWVSVGSWRRTVWGCPFDHLPSSPSARRCPRHRLLEPDTSTRAEGGLGPGPPTDPPDDA
jgi:hypothetical protein